MFAVLAFLNDFAQIRKLIRQVWKDYLDGHLDLMSAAVTTDTAYGIIRRNSEDLMSVLLANFTNWDLLSVAVSRDLKAQTTDETLSHFADRLAVTAACAIEDYTNTLASKKAPIHDVEYKCQHPRESRTQMPVTEKTSQDAAFLSRYLPEIAKLSKGNQKLPAQDELIDGLRTMMDGEKFKACPTHAVFNMQLLLDIHNDLRTDALYPFEELQGLANHCITLIDYQVSHSKDFDIPNKHEKELLQIKHFAQEWVFDGTGKAQNSAAHSQGGKSPLFHFLRMNPVYCGLLTFRLNMLRRDAGQTLANTWGSAIAAMHFYNACRQGCGLNRRWEDAEFVYQIHTTERSFVGAPPKYPQDYRKRLLLMVGASVTNFARNRREGGRHSFVGSKRGRRGFPTESPVTKAFRSR